MFNQDLFQGSRGTTGHVFVSVPALTFEMRRVKSAFLDRLVKRPISVWINLEANPSRHFGQRSGLCDGHLEVLGSSGDLTTPNLDRFVEPPSLNGNLA